MPAALKRPQESSLYEIGMSDVDLLGIDVDEDGDVEFVKSVEGDDCGHDGEFDGDDFIGGNILCGAGWGPR